jgi:hypothetical protein
MSHLLASATKAGPSPRKFGLTIGPLLLVVAAFVAWRGHTAQAQVIEAVGGTLLLLGIVFPRLLAPALRGWMALGHVMGLIMTPIIFTVLWWVAFVPVGFVRRAFSRSPLARDPRATTYWTVRATRSDDAVRASLERQF